MRVIGGMYRGKKLQSLEGEATRPTLDRVKESIFNMAMPYINDAVVLDLFAGSGGLAIEAISRGAAKAYINDSSIAAVRVIESNVKSVGVGDSAVISRLDWKEALKKALQQDISFDIIILDAPYCNDYIYECVKQCQELLNEDGVIIAEHDENTRFTDGVLKEKKYGKVYVTFIGREK